MLLHISPCKYWTITEYKMCEPNPPALLPYSSMTTVADCLFCFSSVLYLEGSVLVFEDVFKLVAFYCVSRWVGFIASMEGLLRFPLWTAFSQYPATAQPQLFPPVSSNLPDQEVFPMLVSMMGPGHPVSSQAHHNHSCPWSGKLCLRRVHRAAPTQDWGTGLGLAGQGGKRVLD